MIWSAISVVGESTIEFFKDKKIVPIYIKLHEKWFYFLLINYLKKVSQKVKTDEILTARAISNLHSCYNFAPVLFEKWTRFQPISVNVSRTLFQLE